MLPGAIDPATGLREVYTFENETLLEAVSNVAHAFVLLAIEPVAEGYIMYVAIYVKNTSWFTPLYLALIDPFRRFIVYPVLIHDLEQAWSDLYAKRPQRPVARRR
ncbi:MAG: hypothetical protein JW395_0813 [Nitrospira sp.]|nr:hypothetical protein [Nitrospira sp.]